LTTGHEIGTMYELAGIGHSARVRESGPHGAAVARAMLNMVVRRDDRRSRGAVLTIRRREKIREREVLHCVRVIRSASGKGASRARSDIRGFVLAMHARDHTAGEHIRTDAL